MRNILVLLGLVMIGVWAAEAPGGWDIGPQPTVQNRRLVLTRLMDRALRQAHPQFRLWRRDEFLPRLLDFYQNTYPTKQPFAVVADFNGDGRNDAAVHGRTVKECFVSVILSEGGGYRVHDLSRIPFTEGVLDAGMTDGKPERGVSTSLLVVPPGRHNFVVGPPMVLKNAGVELSVFGSGAIMFYWDGQKFHDRDAGC